MPPTIFSSRRNEKPWLRDLAGGLPNGFDYRVVTSMADAKALILQLPRCDRARAAAELYRNRDLVGGNVVYTGIMLAWDHDNREIVDAFGSTEQFVAALKDVAPPHPLEPSGSLEAWRGALVNKVAALSDFIGLSWTRSRNIACWFALREYVPVLQPSLVPVVLHAYLNRSVIVVQHNVRAEQELMVDVTRLPLTDSKINLDGTNVSFRDFRTRVADLDPEGRVFDRLIVEWLGAASRYEHWKSVLEARRHLAHNSRAHKTER